MDAIDISKLVSVIDANEEIKKIDRLLEELPRVTTLRRVWDVLERSNKTSLVDVQKIKENIIFEAKFRKHELEQTINQIIPK